jgi:hypothetical protein
VTCLADNFPWSVTVSRKVHAYRDGIPGKKTLLLSLMVEEYLYNKYISCILNYEWYTATFLSLGRREKRKPLQRAIVNQIFMEAKRMVYDLFVDGFPRILLEL